MRVLADLVGIDVDNRVRELGQPEGTAMKWNVCYYLVVVQLGFVPVDQWQYEVFNFYMYIILSIYYSHSTMFAKVNVKINILQLPCYVLICFRHIASHRRDFLIYIETVSITRVLLLISLSLVSVSIQPQPRESPA